jgi:hypothetical protein
MEQSPNRVWPVLQKVVTFLCLGRQESPHCASVSFERHAANAFQQYIHGALGFSIKRGGLLYGSVEEGGNVLVQAIYEPPQVFALVLFLSLIGQLSCPIVSKVICVLAPSRAPVPPGCRDRHNCVGHLMHNWSS